MNKRLKTLSLLLGIACMVGQSSALAKDSAELSEEANKLESHAVNKATSAAVEQNESTTAIDEGKRGAAAEHARKAAKEQQVANKYAKEAHKVEKKAAEKAVKETY